MLEKYRTIIYKSEIEKRKVRDECIEEVMGRNPGCTKEEVLEAIKYIEEVMERNPGCTEEEVFEAINNEDSKKSYLSLKYAQSLEWAESAMLFDVAVKKFGEKLWDSKKTLNRTCKKLCPFGFMCKKYYVQIEGEKFCYGQLHQMHINEEELGRIAKEKQVKLMKPNGDIYIDLNAPEYDEEYDESIWERQTVSNYFFDYAFSFFYFGYSVPYSGLFTCRNRDKINGGELISRL